MGKFQATMNRKSVTFSSFSFKMNNRFIFELDALTVPQWGTRDPNNVHPLGIIERRGETYARSTKDNLHRVHSQHTSDLMHSYSFFAPSGSFLVLLLFTSLNTQTVTTTVPNPTVTTYTDLYVLHSNTLTCPCSSMVTPYHTFILLSPTLHQVCSSDFVTDRWISILKESTADRISIDWRNRAFSQFQLLSDLCQLANRTINDAVTRFIMQSFIASSVPTENDFNMQINATLQQFFQSTIVHFGLLVDMVRLFIQVDQPLMGSLDSDRDQFDASSVGKETTNETDNQQPPQVYLFRESEWFFSFLLVIL